MPYSPTSWVDGTTPVNAANLNKVETQLVAAESAKGVANGYASLDASTKVPVAQIPDLSATYQAVTGKAAANGYASLDSGGKIPSAQLPSGVFVPLSSVAAASGVASLDSGTKVPVAQIPDLSTTYQVRSERASANGYASLDSGGKVPVAQLPVSGAPTPATTLPGSPTDGQQAILVDNTTTPTYAWMLQWSSTASKWVFVGGSSLYATATASGSFANVGATFTDFPTPFSVTVPRAGIYECQFGMRMGGGQALQVAVKFGSTATSANDAVYLDQSTGVTTSLMKMSVSPVVSASDVFKLQYNSATGGNPSGWSAVNIWIAVRPRYLT